MSTITGLGGVNYAQMQQQARSAARVAKPEVEFKLPETGASQAAGPGSNATSSIDMALRSLSEQHNTADKMVLDVASGRDLNVHNTMVALEKADIALKYTVQLRNRALSAYEELMRIQV